MIQKEIYSDILREKINYRKLENGLEIFVLPKKDYTKKFAIFGTRYGSIDNKFIVPGEGDVTEVPEGIAHFLEHKLFESEEGGVFDRFSKLGSNVNAYTNFNSTCYLFSCTDNFYENLEILIDFVQSPYLTDENVEKEKGIIEQEIRMYEDDPNWRVFFNGLRGLYSNHPVKIDIAGTIESIYKINKEQLYKCYNTFYVPNNMVVFVVGDVDIDETCNTIEKNLKSTFKSFEGQVERILPHEPDEVKQKKLEEKLSVSMPLFNIVFKNIDNFLEGRDLLRKDIQSKIILHIIFGNSSKLYQKLYNDGLINENFETEYTFDISYGHSIIGGESKDPDRVYEIICEEIKNIRNKGLNQEDFERIKRKSIGQHISSYNSVEFIANTFISYYFKGINLFDYITELNNLDFESVSRRFNEHFDLSKSVLSLIKPNK
ncbi:EF-P 5-aminopentanol modification-associated protein YfmH [Paramaledivibacter caminithermalis]|jgi:predicted Zn-dependent peptidase|uniref:Predicted Zn-dependent peptidase n=1 Tax=Paramaledivibacter caminithermalis (strain DSM 15212 / CIP 107654 / DViRD3) TaxID=1121301 RepID=A0A1M6S2B1_PARC5|nr:pitrilysin family protein [Paramaledivibacter caminithermalis]SHK38801.1 Predicted Zn-dependent peptidase [Paramaledivibacter caminithermalis DSM 15212]